jgi:hypothetical protein
VLGILLPFRFGGAKMDDDTRRHPVDELHREREQLIEQIRLSQKTIERSRALLQRIDALLAQAEQKKPQV